MLNIENKRYKLRLSVLFGVLSFITLRYATTIEFKSFSINFVWSLILPLLISLSFGFKYGIISIMSGMVIIYPFILGYNNGWASLVPAFALVLWIGLHGYGRDLRLKKKRIYNNIYFIQVFYSILRIILYLTFFPLLIKFNPPIWNPNAIVTIEKNIVFLFAIKGIIVESILLGLGDTLLLLPSVRKIFRLEIVDGSENNEKILFGIILFGFIYTILILIFNNIVFIEKDIFRYSEKFMEIFKINIVFALILFFIMGGMTVKYLQKMMQVQAALKKSEENYREIADELNILNEELEIRIKDRTLELEYAIDELEEYSYVISHDLKTPLRAIDGYVDFILEDYLEKDFVDIENLKNISRISRENIVLIERLLDYSTTSKREIFKEDIDLRRLILNIVEDFKMGNEKLDIIVEMKEMPIISGDIVLFSQVISNIISNSIKFRSLDRKLILNIGYDDLGEENILCFEDNGIGFNMKYSNKIFGIFERLHSSKDYRGMGIGLAIIKKIIQKHKGEVWINSEENVGTRVYIKIPKEL